MSTALINGRILTDEGFAEDHVVVLAGERIEAVLPRARWAAAAGPAQAPTPAHAQHVEVQVEDLRGRYLVPGFIDTQVNGGGGVLFNDDPSIEAIAKIGRAHRRYGTTGFLPTLISDDLHVLARAVRAVQSAIEAGVPGVLGIHIEGPYLNAKRKGVHDASKLRWLDDDALELLAALRGGRTLLTLAPERTTPGMIRRLADAGVIVSAGHTDATCAQIYQALASGLRGFTHLFNAMSQLTGREPGAVGAALEDPESWCGIIADGHHVHPAVLRIALRSKRRDRFMLVTDAMPSVGAPNKSFRLQGRPISVTDNMCIDEEGRLAGSNIDMASAVRNAVRLLGVELPEAARMASRYPAEFLGISAELGRIAAGYRANLALVDEEVQVVRTWIDGEPQDSAPPA